MNKLVTFAKADAAEDRAGFRQWAFAELQRVVTSEALPIGRAILNLVDVDPGAAAWIRPGEAGAGSTDPAYDIVLETWVPDGSSALVSAAISDVLAPRASATWTYLVTESVERENRARRGPERSSGVKYIVQARFFDDMLPGAAQRSWAHHVNLALRIHIGADIYIRNWVEQALTEGAPRVDGITELHFPTVEDMQLRWFSSEYGRAEIIQDIGHFLQSGTRLYTSEYVLR